ncbi:MAG: CPBP family intramembrane metalloprotease [Nitrospira sp.]|nr:CPBP family intramembrane metalloprotease [Nitrospira sp.]
MADNTVQFDQPQESEEIDARPLSGRFTKPFQSEFSRVVNVFSAVILLAAIGTILSSSATFPKLDRIEAPDRALELMVSRMMEAQDGLHRAPAWQQRLTEWTLGSSEKERRQAIEWYRELAQATGDPLSKLRLAILQGEFGKNQDALDEAKTWQNLAAPMPLFGQWIVTAYGAPTVSVERVGELQAALAETLPAGWFYNSLAARLAQQTGDQVLLASVARQREVRGKWLQDRSEWLMIFEIACLFIGSAVLLSLVWLRHRQTEALRVHSPGVPPPWSGGIGTAVLLRGGALGALITMVFLSFPPIEHASLRALAIPLANLPLLALAYVHLLKPTELDFRSGFGLHIDRATLSPLIGAVLAVIAAGLWGEWVMGRVAEWLDLANHWTEWFDPNLVWASGSVLTVSLLEYVIFAPVFEELAFRGLLFAVLRRRFSFAPAALLSASIFALAHGYGLIGFVSVLWSGFLWAWIYEKTGSLIPGMIAHAVNNLLVSLTVMALLR